ncbi:hypothetical protein MMC14_009196 [Varicellaria rhodocarpa]|nr:hypothetical protein [Varicellaria rhodocarpa]
MTRQSVHIEIEDNRPIAVRRKRRMSSGLTSPKRETQSDNSSHGNQSVSGAAKTPTKPKKRVRFSDPFPETSTATSSTGITPYMKRSVLTADTHTPSSSSPRLLARSPRQRASLPSKLAFSDSASKRKAFPPSGEIQFAPLREVLDERMKRRLRRSHLSDEINEIDHERKTDIRRQQEIRDLKDEIALARQLNTEAAENADANIGNTEKIQRLEEEIRGLKEEMRERSAPAASPSALLSDDPFEPAMNESIYEDGIEDDDFLLVNHSSGILEEAVNGTTEMEAQTNLSSSEIASLEERLKTQASHLVEARLELEHICPGETTIGLTIENGDAKPVLDALLDQLRSLKVLLVLSESALGTSQTQESNLRAQFNAVLEQLGRARVYGEDIAGQNKTYISKLETAKSEVEELKADMSEKDQTIEKLQRALESYRKEVVDLESLVTKLEVDHEIASSQLRGQMDEAVADLECHVAAETRGRREAEAVCEKHKLDIKEFIAKEMELKGAVKEKQSLIRRLEQDLGQTREDRESEVGALNARIAGLGSTSEGLKLDLAELKKQKAKLIHRVEIESQAGVIAMEKMRAEMKRGLEHMDAMREAHLKDARSRGAEVAEHQGLLTPTSAVRYKDAESYEGHVEVARGKSRRKRGIDSGVGILEEDEDEYMMNANM